jgi:calcium uptake protein 3, mitochondrial
MEKIFSFAWRGKRGLENVEETGDPDDHLVDDEQGLQRKHKVDATLQIHFFGKKGNKGGINESFLNSLKEL